MSMARIVIIGVLVGSFFGCAGVDEPPPRSTNAAITGEGTASTSSVDANQLNAAQTPPQQ